MIFRVVSLACMALAAVSAQNGRSIFETRCAHCHGADGRGGERGPNITARPAGEAHLRTVILKGAGAMPPQRIPDAEMTPLVVFVRSLYDATNGARIAVKPLPFERIVKPKSGEWPTYHGSLSGNRHSELDEINTDNVKNVTLQWIYPFSDARRLEGTPVVVDGVMYVTAVNEAVALDAADGHELWRFRRPRSEGLVGDTSSGINRGVAVLGDRIFIVTDNAHLLALDRSNGRLVWETTMADSIQNYGATSAPLVVKDRVISGVSGGDEGVRGFVAAYDAASGKQLWRFWSVPDANDPAAATWKGNAREHACGATWMSGTYDPSTDLLFWGTGNPCPDYNGDERVGDNLYTDSVLALSPDTGTLRWYYQFTPHDLHDWDGQQTPMLVDTTWHGAPRKLLLQANRNGFFYVLDRTNGKLLLAKPFVKKITWAREVDSTGRPIVLPNSDPTPEGTKTCPAVEGATNWFSTAFHPATGLFYVMALEKCDIYSKSPAVWTPGKSYYGGATRQAPGENGQKVLRALDVQTGEVAWEYPQSGAAQSWGGVLTTAGGLVFFGEDNGNFSAADARTGKVLWQFRANARWHASPMTFTAGGHQYIAVASGANILVFGVSR